jgi:Asp-tRNA(Asn)/Glu-tRNA(Gln) amidotransferase A subunit family amidase
MTNTHLPPSPVAVSGPHAAEVSGSLVEQARAIRRGELSSRELTRMYLERIEALDTRDALNAFVLSRGDQVLAEAARLDEQQTAGKPTGPLHGIPLGFKDNIFTAGTATAGGTEVLRGFVPERDATLVRLLKSAGALVLGKTNLHECSFGITTVNPHFGATRNPYDPRRIPGGSSGGSGAAVAAHLCSAAIGADTGGSVRIPSALCGVAGIKPTVGRVSRAGMFGLAWTSDTPGPIARTVADAALMLRVLAGGPDPLDPAASDGPAGAALTAALADDPARLRGVRIGIPDGYFAADNAPDVDKVLAEVHRVLEGAGAVLVPVTVAGADRAIPTGFVTIIPEGVVLNEEALRTAGVAGGIAGNLDRYGPDVREALAGEVGPGAHPVPAFRYAEAISRTIPALRKGFTDALAEVDALLTPTTPATACLIDENTTMRHNGRDVSTFETFLRYTFGVSITGLPAVSVPAGVDGRGLPVGVQLIGAPWTEARLVDIAHGLELALAGDLAPGGLVPGRD